MSEIFGIGTDIIEVVRMKKMVARGKPTLEAIFTLEEINYCTARARQSEHFAVRFAAKEAILKAMGTGWRGGLAFSEIEIINDELGKPEVFLHGEVKKFFEGHQIRHTFISLSHTKEIAMAFVILEKQ